MCDKIGWYFPIETNASDRYVDEFADSKFSIDRWVSFAREVIQNSLDVKDDKIYPPQPVLVKMECQELTIDEIPGCTELRDCIEKAMKGAEEKQSNKQTIKRYKKGLDVLAQPKIFCFKVADFNTKGVASGRDAEWGALVYDEGKSVKHRPGAAGSHGVGKKAPFIISALNTVFYATLNKNGESLLQGKTSLINWNDDAGQTRSGKGWFGYKDEDNVDRRLKVGPIISPNQDDFHPFFIRKEQYGTDVIVVGVSFDNFEDTKKRVINSILENFFVAIYHNDLELEVFNEHIYSGNLGEYVDKYYLTSKKNVSKVSGLETNIFGNLLNYYRAFLNEPISFDVVHNKKRYGRCKIYFSLENDKNKKYYCIFRNHGMKIRDIELSSSEQPYSAVLYIEDLKEDELEENDRLNARLSEVENAAHDDFVITDEDFECDPITKELVKFIYDQTKSIILEKTKIEVLEDTPLSGLDDMLSIQGILTSKLSNKQPPKVNKRKSRIKKKGAGNKGSDYERGTTSVGGKKRKHKKGEGENNPAEKGDTIKATLFENFKTEPMFIKTSNGYNLILTTNEDILADIKISPITVEGDLGYMPKLLVEAEMNGNKLTISDNTIKDVNFAKDHLYNISISIQNNYNYSLECELYVGGKNNG